jgi:hypothetical protein
MQSFIFGGDTGLTPEDIKRQRMIAAALAESRTPQNVGEGVGAVMRGIAGALVNARANSAERTGKLSATQALSPILAALSDASDTSSNVTTTTPDFSPDAAVKDTAPDTAVKMPPIKSPQDAVDAAPFKPVETSSKDVAGLEAYIRQSAQKRGIDPDIAVKVARSEGLGEGIWQSRLSKNGVREPSYGPFQMLVGDGKTYPKGVGNDFMNKTGLDPRDPKNVNAMIDFALDTAKRDGWRQWYGAKKVGVNRWDGLNANQVASLDDTVPAAAIKPATEQVPVVDVPEGFQQPDPLETQQKPAVEVAQATTTATPKRAKNEPSDDVVIKALMNPWLDDSQRAVAEMYYKQRINEREFQRKLEAERNDPKYKMELEKGQLEIDKLRNPPKARNLTDDDEKALGLDPTGVYQEKPDGTIATVREPKVRKTVTVNGRVLDEETGQVISEVPLQINPLEKDKAALDREKFDWEKTKPTQDIQEYQFYEDREKAAGRQPLGPLEWDQARRKASAQNTTVNNNMKTEGEFEKEAAKKQAEFFSTLADEGLNARADLDVVNQLDAFLKDNGGMGTGLATTLSKWGIPFEGAGDLQAADALINKLVPTQRAPGSGTMSDRDVQLFKDSLPSLWNQPGGNEKILGVMRGMADYKSRQGEIADMVLNGDMTRQEGRRALRELPNPLEEFRNAKKNAEKPESDDKAAKDDLPQAPEGIDAELWQMMTPEERDLWLK